MHAADKPTYNQLLNLKNADGSNVKVIKWITSLEQWQCTDFAHMLLKDDVLVSKYENEHIMPLFTEWKCFYSYESK